VFTANKPMFRLVSYNELKLVPNNELEPPTLIDLISSFQQKTEESTINIFKH